MKIKLDENLPSELVDDFRAAGHEVHTVADEGLAGASDPDVAAAARREQRVLLAMDKGFADVRVYRPTEHAGIIVVRLRVAGRRTVRDFVRHRIPSILDDGIRGHLAIVTERGVRLR